MNVLDFILIALQSVANLVDDKAEKAGTDVGRKVNTLVASTETGFDNYAKRRVVAFLKAATAALESGEVDDVEEVAA